MHGEGNAAFGDQVGVAAVVLVIVREHRADDGTLIEEAAEHVAGVREPAVHEHAMDEICAHVQCGEATAPTREANALDIAEALELDHPTKLAGAGHTVRSG